MIRGVPYDAEVEYLQSSGTQYIDTGWVFQKNIRLVFDITYIGSGTFGRNAGSYEFFWSGSSFYFGGGRSTVTRSNNVRYEMDCDFTAGKMVAKVNGNVVRQTTGTQPTDTKIVLFSFTTGRISPQPLRHGRFSIYKDGVAVLDMVPVRIGTEGAMYDRVSKKMFRNNGTGAFSYGPDVATPVMGLHFMRGGAMTAKDYIQDGLIAMWDGIENAGWGVHDSSSTVWKELVNGWDLPMPSGTVWNEDSVGPLNTLKNGYFGKASKQEMSVAMAANNAAFEISFLKTGDTLSPEWHTATAQGLNFYLRFIDNQVAMYNDGGMTGSGNYFYNFRLSKNVFHTLVLNMESGKKCQVYADGIKVDESRNVGNFGIHLWKTGNYMQKWSFGAEKQYCCRIYNRNLTPAEIAANHIVDKARFDLT